MIETASDYVFWVNISSVLTNLDEDLLLGVMYIPPSQSKYLNEDEIMNLEMEITLHCNQYKYIILTGDINARTAELRDYTVADNFIADFFILKLKLLSFFISGRSLFLTVYKCNADHRIEKRTIMALSYWRYVRMIIYLLYLL